MMVTSPSPLPLLASWRSSKPSKGKVKTIITTRSSKPRLVVIEKLTSSRDYDIASFIPFEREELEEEDDLISLSRLCYPLLATHRNILWPLFIYTQTVIFLQKNKKQNFSQVVSPKSATASSSIELDPEVEATEEWHPETALVDRIPSPSPLVEVPNFTSTSIGEGIERILIFSGNPTYSSSFKNEEAKGKVHRLSQLLYKSLE